MASKRPLEARPWSTCARCQVEFYALNKAQLHFHTTCRDLWCDLCYEAFETPEKTREHASAHRDYSSVCPRCGFNAGTGGDVVGHWVETGCHKECPACKVWYYKESFDVHLELNPYCRCLAFNSRFAQPAQPSVEPELQTPFEPQVYEGARVQEEDGMGTRPPHPSTQGEHVPASGPSSGPGPQTRNQGAGPSRNKKRSPVMCPGCAKFYPFPASMLNHAETGNCPSLIDTLDVNYTFATFPEAEILLPCDNRRSLGSFLNYERIRDERPFRCCGLNCGLSFSVLSALIQHADSGSGCSASCGQQELVAHLRMNLYYQSVVHKIQKLGRRLMYDDGKPVTKAALMNTATMFIRAPPYNVYQGGSNITEHWSPVLSALVSHLLSAVDNVLCGQPNQQGRNFIAFKRPYEIGKNLEKIMNVVTELRNKLRNLERGMGGDSCLVMVHFKGTDETLPLGRFLNEVENFRNVIGKEFQEMKFRPNNGQSLGR
ncbi:hypothetical protein TWF481_004137 [Arthrobotrys musiformis]|uniref:C2H2-type domain-containing protein n=1 Tax=Arthrobotrys musiformis TaxID=47236 RepID=A0AAV9WIL3_9PEZI